MLSRLFGNAKRSFESLSEQEILALAISSEEDDARIYLAYADTLRDQYPQSAKVFEDMAAVENEHRQMLIDMHASRFGSRIPLIRREHVRGVLRASAGLADAYEVAGKHFRGSGTDGSAGLPFLYGGDEAGF